MLRNTTTSFNHLSSTASIKHSGVMFERGFINDARVKISLERINVFAKHCLKNLANSIIMQAMPQVSRRVSFVFGVGC